MNVVAQGNQADGLPKFFKGSGKLRSGTKSWVEIPGNREIPNAPPCVARRPTDGLTEKGDFSAGLAAPVARVPRIPKETR